MAPRRPPIDPKTVTRYSRLLLILVVLLAAISVLLIAVLGALLIGWAGESSPPS
jgi:hypothetical protein